MDVIGEYERVPIWQSILLGGMSPDLVVVLQIHF